MLFSSQLLGLTKPDLAIYRKAADLMGVQTEECIMVAAHAYDLRAAKETGMKTVYVRRETEDVGEDFGKIEKDVDLFLDGRDGSVKCGIAALATELSAHIS
jgi:FMN phosphatase YigB (HAD superfamily)